MEIKIVSLNVVPQMFGRTLKINIARDNGRSTEFDKKRTYADTQRCFECGQDGHLSYKCPSNVLGSREPPSKKSNQKNRNFNAAINLEERHANDDNNENTSIEDVRIQI